MHGSIFVGQKIRDDFLILKRRMQRGISDKLLLFFAFVAQQYEGFCVEQSVEKYKRFSSKRWYIDNFI